LCISSPSKLGAGGCGDSCAARRHMSTVKLTPVNELRPGIASSRSLPGCDVADPPATVFTGTGLTALSGVSTGGSVQVVE